MYHERKEGLSVFYYIQELFEETSFVVMPYTDATQTGIIQVAYSFNKPVIATSVGSLPELVQNKKRGLLIPPKSTKKLKEAIEFLLSKPETAKKYGENAGKFMEEELDWNKIVKKLYGDLKK